MWFTHHGSPAVALMSTGNWSPICSSWISQKAIMPLSLDDPVA